MGSFLRRGWIGAAVRGAVVALIVAALGEAVSFSLYGAHVLPHETAAQAAQQGMLLFYSFHRVTLEIHTAALRIPSIVNGTIGLPVGFDTRARLGLCLMTGTVIAMWLLARAGRAVANRVGGDPRARAFQGAKVGLVYGALSCATSWFVEGRQALPHTSLLVIRAAHFSAFVWPFVIGAIAGGIGGFGSADPSAIREWLGYRLTEKWIRRSRGIVAGATRMLVLSLVFSFIGLASLALFDPSARSAYFRTISSKGASSGVAIAEPTALAIPNMGAWALVPAMGGCLEIASANGSMTSAITPYCFESYSNTLAHPAQSANREWTFLGFHELRAPSAWFLLFLLAPLAASFMGGGRAARIAEAVDAREALYVTALAAALFAVLIGLTLMLAWVTLTTSGDAPGLNNYVRYGPYPFDGAQLALGWGLIFGGIGGVWAARTSRRDLRFEGELL